MESYPLTYAASTVHLCLFAVRNAAELRSRLVAASQLPDDDEGNKERKAVDFAFIDARMVSQAFVCMFACPCRCSTMSQATCSCLWRPLQITSRMHALVAVQQALLAQADDALKTRTIHSEVLWMLEPGTNVGPRYGEDSTASRAHLDFCPPESLLAQISDSLKHFGLTPSTRFLLLVHIAPLVAGGDAVARSRTEADEVLKRMNTIVEGDVLSLEDLGRLPDAGTDEKAIRKVSAQARLTDLRACISLSD